MRTDEAILACDYNALRGRDEKIVWLTNKLPAEYKKVRSKAFDTLAATIGTKCMCGKDATIKHLHTCEQFNEAIRRSVINVFNERFKDANASTFGIIVNFINMLKCNKYMKLAELTGLVRCKQKDVQSKTIANACAKLTKLGYINEVRPGTYAILHEIPAGIAYTNLPSVK